MKHRHTLTTMYIGCSTDAVYTFNIQNYIGVTTSTAFDSTLIVSVSMPDNVQSKT